MTWAGRCACAVGAIVLAWTGCARPTLDESEVPLPDLAGAEAQVVEAVQEARRVVFENPRSARAWGALGDRYFVHEWYEQAASSYARAEELAPGDFLWPYRRGFCLTGAGDLSGAADALSRALPLNDSYAPAHLAYAKVLSRLGRDEEAERHYTLASEMNPRSSHAELGLGHLALAAGDLETARAHLAEAIERNPEHGEAHHALAQVLLASGDREGAARHADLVSSLPKSTPMVDPLVIPQVKPAGSSAHTAHGEKLEREGRVQEAEEHYREAIRCDPEHMPAHYSLGSLLARVGRMEEAAEHLETAVRLKSTRAPAWERLGFVLTRLERYEEAEEALRKGLEVKPGGGSLHATLGDLLARRGRHEEALSHLSEAVRLKPDRVEFRMRFGGALLGRGRAEEAEAHFREAMRMLPGDVEVCVALGDALVAQGKIASALPYYKRTIRMRPKGPNAARQLAWIYAAHPESALRDGLEALRLAESLVRATSGRHPAALDALAAAYAELGLFDDAVAKARAARDLASSSGMNDLAGQIEARVRLYESRRPYRGGIPGDGGGVRPGGA